MLKNSSSLVRVILLLSISIWLSSAGIAQGKPGSAEKKTKAANESCDGALDIVPSKPMTFARKRRPSTTGTKQPVPAPADAKSPGKGVKSEKQQSSDGR